MTNKPDWQGALERICVDFLRGSRQTKEVQEDLQTIRTHIKELEAQNGGLLTIIDKAMDWWDGGERHPDTMQSIRGEMKKALQNAKEEENDK